MHRSARLKQSCKKVLRRKSLHVEALEDRCTPTTFYVANAASFAITNDVGPVGLSAGDTVTWDPGTNTSFAGPVTNLTFGTNAFASIQDAVNAASAGDTIDVAAGTYSEKVTVNKAVTLDGAQFGHDGATGRPASPGESIMNANAGTTPFYLTASNVVLDGFTIQGVTNANVFGFGVLVGAGTSGAHVLDNIIQNNIAGLSLANNSASNQAVIQHNLFKNNNQPGPASGSAIYTDQYNAGGTLTNVLIDSNTFINNQNAGMVFASTFAGSQSHITISNNSFTSNGNAVALFNTNSATISGNTITGSTASQIVIYDGSSNVLVTNNFITNGFTRGIRVDNSGGGPNSFITITSNYIAGNATTGLEVGSTGYVGTLDATRNYWGSPTGPTTASNPAGTGDKIIDPNLQVNYRPFFTDGTDTQPGVPGLQPSLADVSVTNSAGANPVLADSNLTYTITVQNNGPTDAQNLQLSDTMPANTTFVSLTAPSGWSANTPAIGGTGAVTATRSTLGTADGPQVFTLVVHVNGMTAAGTTLSDSASISATSNDLNPANNSATATTTNQAQLGFAVGADVGGGSNVKVYNTDGSLRFNFMAFAANFTGGVRVATGDVNGDGVPDIIAAEGPGGQPLVEVFDGVTESVIAKFMAYAPNFTGGVYVAAADVNGDGKADIITGAGAGGGPHVEVIDGTKLNQVQGNGQIADTALLQSFFAYDVSFTGGVRVAAADVTGDHKADIITGAGVGGGPHVLVFNGVTQAPVYSFMAFDPSYSGGVYVAGGDLNGDGRADIVVSQGQGTTARVRAFSGATSGQIADFLGFNSGTLPDGVRVAVTDRDGDGQADIDVSAGPGGLSRVAAYKGTTHAPLSEFNAYDPTFLGGVFVG